MSKWISLQDENEIYISSFYNVVRAEVEDEIHRLYNKFYEYSPSQIEDIICSVSRLRCAQIRSRAAEEDRLKNQ